MSKVSKKMTSLSAKKKAVLELKLKRLKEQKKKTRQQKAKIESPKIVRRAVTGPEPLSLDQERLWFISQFAPENAAYNIHTATRLLGPLDVDLLEKSLNEVIKRHDVLRTSFIAQNGQPMQVIAPTLTLKIPVIDVQDLSPAEQEAQVMWYAEEEAQLPFDMTKAPLLRVWLLKISDVNYVIYLNQHHIITDWWSAQQLFQEIATIYDALLIGQPLVGLLPEPYQYTDFVLWERERLEKQDMERSLAYWRKHLAGGTFQLDLPIAKRRPAEQTFVGLRQKVTIPPALGEALKAFSRRENVTLFMTLTAAFKALLFRYSGQTDITLGTPLANRSQVELEHVLGFLITMLVLHSDFSEDISFNSLVHKERKAILEAYAHQDVPFAKLLEIVQLERDWSRNPLFQFSFIFLDDAGRPGGGFKSLEGHGLFYDPHASRFDMTLIAEDHGEKIICYIEYNTDLFEADSMARFAEHFRTLLESMVAAPDKPIAELPMMTEAERQQVLFELNDTVVHYPTEMCMQHLFEAQVERTPLAVAVTFGEASLTYHELNQRANQLAYQLLELGVGPEVLVGICVERSLEMVVGLLGILKAGCAYVALDPAYPKERQAFTLQDAKVSILLTQQHLADTLLSSGLTLLFLDQAVASKVMPNPVAPVAPHNLAYILYTSGSTGRPKGVAIEHRSVVAFLSWAQSVFPAEELAGVLASTSICFDLSVFEIFLPLSCGGTVIVVENALALPTLPANPPVTLINTVPSAMRELVRMNGVPKSVRVVNLAGEPLPNTLVQAAYAQETVEKIYNLYGPSEDTTYSTFVLTEKGVLENPSIGRPIANTQAYLLDRALQPVPIGLPGQLYLGGAGLARGYLNRPALTAERFVDNPFGSGHLYNTGDLARYLLSEEKALGNIQFLGRIDHQVKLRGFRIELGEIETILSQHGTVQETVVIVREDQAGDQRLVAYIVLSTAEALRRFDAKEFVIPELRAHLKQKLPDYMIPGFFVVLDHLPLTPNGKIDRRALPAPDRSSAQESYMPPSTPTEERLAAIWADILGVARVGRHDDFFMLGGHSLLVMQVILQVNHALEIDLPLRQLLSNPTVAELAHWIESTRQTLAGLQDMMDIGDEDEDEREEFVL